MHAKNHVFCLRSEKPYKRRGSAFLPDRAVFAPPPPPPVCSRNRWTVLQTEFAKASEVSNSSKHSLAVTIFSQRKCSCPTIAKSFLPETPHWRFTNIGGLNVSTILFKIITRMRLLFSNDLEDYSYSFQGSSELISITVAVFLFSLQNAVTGKNFLQYFSYIIQLFSSLKCNDFEKNGTEYQ